jgi:hypothetical protein
LHYRENKLDINGNITKSSAAHDYGDFVITVGIVTCNFVRVAITIADFTTRDLCY